MSTKQTDALKLALEALESCSAGDYSTGHVIHPSFDVDAVNKAIDAVDEALAEPKAQQQDLPDFIAGAFGVSRGTAYDMMREALAEQPAQQEPVIDKSAAIRIATALGWEPRREWVGLTDAERGITAAETWGSVLIAPQGYQVFAHAIEAKLREKNA